MAEGAVEPEVTESSSAGGTSGGFKRNPLVYFDITIGNKSAGRITMEVCCCCEFVFEILDPYLLRL